MFIRLNSVLWDDSIIFEVEAQFAGVKGRGIDFWNLQYRYLLLKSKFISLKN